MRVIVCRPLLPSRVCRLVSAKTEKNNSFCAPIPTFNCNVVLLPLMLRVHHSYFLYRDLSVLLVNTTLHLHRPSCCFVNEQMFQAEEQARSRMGKETMKQGIDSRESMKKTVEGDLERIQQEHIVSIMITSMHHPYKYI